MRGIPLNRLAPYICLAASATAALAQPEAGLRIEAGSLHQTVSVREGHLVVSSLEDAASGHSLTISEPFVLSMADGREVRASAMQLAQAPARSPLAAEPTASRAAARLAGQQVCAALRDAESDASVHWCLIARGGAPYLRQEVTIRAGATSLPLAEVRLVDVQDAQAEVSGAVAGSPLVAGNFYFGMEHPLAGSLTRNGLATSSLKRVLPLAAGQAITYSSVTGLARPGQMRRDFLGYIELERAHPYRTFLHYNSWYDLGEGERFGSAQVLDRMHAFGEKLVRSRGVTLDSFLMDDGWDNTSSLWQFNSGFPDGFTPLKAAAAQYGFGLGVWFSPWGGYGREKQERIAYGTSQGYEIVKGGYALSGPRYYARFEEACLRFVTEYGVNQFKIDGTGNAGTVFPGSVFDSDFAAAIHLIERLRTQESGLFVNLTTGTKPSPFWLRYADSIWRSGEDHDFAGEGSWRQRWITYRDAQTYRNIVQMGPLFPLNSLMLHGIIYAQKAEHLGDDPGHDFATEVQSYFGSGTQLQEMYITPELLSADDWDVLAECARWSRRNAETLKDTHWIGGDPGKAEVYGWASWSGAGERAEKAILVLRNPSSKTQSIPIEVGKAFELPPGAAQRFRAYSPWLKDKGAPAIELRARIPQVFSLKPYEVLTLEADPLP